MPKFSRSSKAKLETCHTDLQKVAEEVVKFFDCTVVCGFRSEELQNKAYEAGNSKLKFPESKHNFFPSKAIDLAPYIAGKGIVWDKEQCYYFAGVVMGVAHGMGIKLRWGGDWDGDNDVHDQSFDDLVHFEIVE